ncbi:MAG TPA: ATP-binding protein [Verrucomicrobiae bacterium]|nr:ATP-binding protein [Verrucomicrobiae bacterium]
MSLDILDRPSGSPQESIRLLQQELAETNREVLLLTVELDKRVEQRTAELCAAQEELKRKNAELMQRSAQLESANKELEMFSYSVSHDLRAPLRRIDGFVQVLLADCGQEMNPEAQGWLGKISTAATEMARLIDDLLAFSRMGRAEMRETVFNMGDLVKEAVERLAADTQGRNIEWDVGTLPVVRGDPAMLRQVWANLISNAIKYSRPRNPARIKINCASRENEWQFEVRDNGVGFDMKYVNKLFGVFQRLHHADEFEGTGIGLANVQQIIRRHGGRTWAEGKIGEGAAFFFTLPK